MCVCKPSKIKVLNFQDLRALCLIFSIEQPREVPKEFIKIMNRLIEHCNQLATTENCKASNCKDQEMKQDGETEEKPKESIKGNVAFIFFSLSTLFFILNYVCM